LLSFTPGFSPVTKDHENHENRFNGFFGPFCEATPRIQPLECL